MLTPDEARVAEQYYDIGPHGEMHHNSEKNVLWIGASIEALAKKLGMDEVERAYFARAREGKIAGGAPRAAAHSHN